MRYRTLFLFAKPSFLGGAARVLDLGATMNMHNGSRSGAEADYFALRGDWRMVGTDIARAIEHYDETQAEQTELAFTY